MRGPFVNVHTALVLHGRAADYELCGWRLPMCLSWVMYLCTYVHIVAQVTKFTLIIFLAFWYSYVILRQLHCKYQCAYLLPSLSLSVCVCCTVCQFDVSLYICMWALSPSCVCVSSPQYTRSQQRQASLCQDQGREGRQRRREGEICQCPTAGGWLGHAWLAGCMCVVNVHMYCTYMCIRMCMFIGMYVYT